jgi:hypothetical protein
MGTTGEDPSPRLLKNRALNATRPSQQPRKAGRKREKNRPLAKPTTSDKQKLLISV